MKHASAVRFQHVIGIDISDREAQFVKLDLARKVVAEGKFSMTREAIRKQFEHQEELKIIVETGSHSSWVVRLLRELGHEVVLADARRLPLISKGSKKTDRRDAELLARLGIADDDLLTPVHLRSEQTLRDRAVLMARDGLVRARTKLITMVRGLVKPFGERIPACSAEAFAAIAIKALPAELKPVLHPALEMIAELTQQIRKQDREIAKITRARYPAAKLLQQISGVGPVTSLAFVLTIEEPARFKRSRDVAPYLGLTPRAFLSGKSAPQLGITKAGDRTTRRLLVNSAQYVLGHFGPDCDLKRFGEAICARGGDNAKKRAVVAVARKLAVLMHRLWASGDKYDPDHKQNQNRTRMKETDQPVCATSPAKRIKTSS